MTTSQALPPALAEIVQDFQELEERDRLTLLLEFSRSLPPLPERLSNHPELLEQVVECQSPLFLTVESEQTEQGEVMRIFFQGFASVLFEGLDGLTAAEILAVPNDMPEQLGLTRAISPLRMRGMSAMLGRVKHKIVAGVRPAA